MACFNGTARRHGDDLFVIARNDALQLCGSSADFSNALTAELGTHPVLSVGARGGWHSGTATVTSRFVVVRLQ